MTLATPGVMEVMCILKYSKELFDYTPSKSPLILRHVTSIASNQYFSMFTRGTQRVDIKCLDQVSDALYILQTMFI